MNSEQPGDLKAKGPTEDELVVKNITFFFAIVSTLFRRRNPPLSYIDDFSNFRVYNLSNQKFETLIDYLYDLSAKKKIYSAVSISTKSLP
jgi:hypothetical protein